MAGLRIFLPKMNSTSSAERWKEADTRETASLKVHSESMRPRKLTVPRTTQNWTTSSPRTWRSFRTENLHRAEVGWQKTDSATTRSKAAFRVGDLASGHSRRRNLASPKISPTALVTKEAVVHATSGPSSEIMGSL